MHKPGIFIASTGKDVGKTTTCLGLLAGLRSRIQRVGFIKPVGQQHVRVDGGQLVDKDVVLFKEIFALEGDYAHMSPVIFGRTFTRDFIDEKISIEEHETSILRAFSALSASHDCIVVEGTGHVGVGSIAMLNNAKVASLLGLDMIIVSSGGLGSAFDTLALNKSLCDAYGITIRGVILNRVLPDKQEMVTDYMSRALGRWNIPLLGCIPYDHLLSAPCMRDFELLFKKELFAGQENRLRHFKRTRLVATSVETYKGLKEKGQLVITPATREDIVLETLRYHWDEKIKDPNADIENGIILTGSFPPRAGIIEQIKKADIPALYADVNSFDAMKKITSYIAKIRQEDTEKVNEAITLVEKHIDFEGIQEAMTRQ